MADFNVYDAGSVVMVTPVTDVAHDWLKANTSGTWFSGGLAVEPRYADELIDGMVEDGLVLGALDMASRVRLAS